MFLKPSVGGKRWGGRGGVILHVAALFDCDLLINHTVSRGATTNGCAALGGRGGPLTHLLTVDGVQSEG